MDIISVSHVIHFDCVMSPLHPAQVSLLLQQEWILFDKEFLLMRFLLLKLLRVPVTTTVHPIEIHGLGFRLFVWGIGLLSHWRGTP